MARSSDRFARGASRSVSSSRGVETSRGSRASRERSSRESSRSRLEELRADVAKGGTGVGVGAATASTVVTPVSVPTAAAAAIVPSVAATTTPVRVSSVPSATGLATSLGITKRADLSRTVGGALSSTTSAVNKALSLGTKAVSEALEVEPSKKSVARTIADTPSVIIKPEEKLDPSRQSKSSAARVKGAVASITAPFARATTSTVASRRAEVQQSTGTEESGFSPLFGRTLAQRMGDVRATKQELGTEETGFSPSFGRILANRFGDISAARHELGTEETGISPSQGIFTAAMFGDARRRQEDIRRSRPIPSLFEGPRVSRIVENIEESTGVEFKPPTTRERTELAIFASSLFAPYGSAGRGILSGVARSGSLFNIVKNIRKDPLAARRIRLEDLERPIQPKSSTTTPSRPSTSRPSTSRTSRTADDVETAMRKGEVSRPTGRGSQPSKKGPESEAEKAMRTARESAQRADEAAANRPSSAGFRPSSSSTSSTTRTFTRPITNAGRAFSKGMKAMGKGTGKVSKPVSRAIGFGVATGIGIVGAGIALDEIRARKDDDTVSTPGKSDTSSTTTATASEAPVSSTPSQSDAATSVVRNIFGNFSDAFQSFGTGFAAGAAVGGANSLGLTPDSGVPDTDFSPIPEVTPELAPFPDKGSLGETFFIPDPSSTTISDPDVGLEPEPTQEPSGSPSTQPGGVPFGFTFTPEAPEELETPDEPRPGSTPGVGDLILAGLTTGLGTVLGGRLLSRGGTTSVGGSPSFGAGSTTIVGGSTEIKGGGRSGTGLQIVKDGQGTIRLILDTTPIRVYTLITVSRPSKFRIR